jgi:hypothetical protein
MYEKPRAYLCERVFRSRSGLPRFFFLLFGAFFLFLSQKKEEKCGYEKEHVSKK